MKKITLLLIALGFVFNASAQYVFSPIAGPTNVASGSPVTINLNDLANTAAVPASSTGSYNSFSVSVDWTDGNGTPWSSEADLTFTITAGSTVVDPPTTGGLNSGAATTMTFEGDLVAPYDPTVDGFIDLILNQSFGGSNANWSNIVVTLFESPTCIVPSGMISTDATTTSINLDWVAGNTETVWNLEWNGGADFTPGNGEQENLLTVNTNPTSSLSSLTPFTEYFLYYQADCGNGDTSEWVGPFTFLTGYCISDPISNDGQGITEVILGSQTFPSGGDLTFEDFTATVVDLSAAVTANLQITFATGFTYNTNVWIDLNNDLVYDNDTELLFQGESTNQNPTTLDASFVMPDVPLGIYNMRIGTADFGQNPPNPCFNGSFGVTVDMVVNITEAPDCIPASALSATNITETTADLVWNGGATGVTWDLEWGLDGFTPGTGTLVTGLTTASLSLSGLTAGTSYDFYVVSNCASSTANPTGPSSFITAIPGETCANAFSMTVEADCGLATPVTFDFANGADTGLTGEDPTCDGFGNFGYWISFTAPAIGSVIFNFDGAASGIGLEVFDACGGTPIFDCVNNTLDAGENSGIIGGLTPGNTYVAIVWRDTQSGTADICIEEGPECPFPINLNAINITESSADLAWTENGTATSWNVEWGIQGFTPGTGTLINGVTTNPLNLPGLTQNTSYDFYVQAICGSGNSEFSGPFTFATTPQSNFTLDCANDGPLTQDYCYENGGATNPFIFTFTSNDGTPLNLTFNSGFVENNWDELVVLDSDGTPFPGFSIADQNYGNAGNIGGLTFQSIGDTISFFINSDGSISCGSGAANLSAGINYTVSCATCINPQASFQVVDDCDNGDQFLVDVNITSLGDATSVSIADNQGSTPVSVTETGITQFGPYPFLTDIIFTISNDQDVNCVITSSPIQLLACPPVNDNCDGAIVAGVNTADNCDIVTPGTILAATPSGVPVGSCAGNPDDDVWFEFTAENEVQIISLQNIVGGTFNLDHAVYEGNCGALTELYCSPNASSVTPQLVVGNTYFIRVFSFGGVEETSNFELCIRPAPNNIICENAENFCSDGGALTSSNIIGIPNTGQIACLFTAPNPTWNIIQVGDPGLIQIQINQNNAGGGGLDVDFVLWGPFTSLEDACNGLETGCPAPGDCPNNTTNANFYPFGNIVDCSYSAASVENLTINNAQSGEIYILLVTNFSNQPGTISIEQTNGANTGDGTVTAEIEASITSDEVLFIDIDNDPSTPEVAEVCGIETVAIRVDSPFADSFIWFKDGFVIEGETGSTLIVTESDNYQVQAFDEQCDTNAFSQIIEVRIYREATATQPADIVTCEEPTSNDGIEDFDLNAQIPIILGGQDPELFTVTFYTSLADANQAINAISSPFDSAGQTIYVRVEDIEAAADGFLGCRDITQFEVVVSGPTPTATSVDFEVCDDISRDGVELFDLASHDAAILDGQDATIFNVSYYLTEADANANINAIVSPFSNTSNPQTIYTRVESNVAVDCFSVTDFNLIVSDVPFASFNNEEVDFEVCPNATVPIEISLIPEGFTAADVTVEWELDGAPFNDGSGLAIPVLLAGTYTAFISFNSTGCEFVVNAEVIELEQCIIPEGISPNNDGLNDVFDLSSFDVTRIEIFNRNGRSVFKMNNYRDEWFGQSDEGKELPVGTYFYTMTYEGGAKRRSAWVYISR